ncbi:MAG: hypothetical protein Q7T54_04265 [Candidatus Levybacteria bacterium]|nr:hypothetical protein [Candidatus Levybacteria bacterium]
MKKIRKFVKSRKSGLIVIALIAVIVDVFFLTGQSDIKYFGVLTLYGFVYWITKFGSITTFLFCIFLLILLCIYYLLLGTVDATEKIAVWFVLFFAIGVIQKWRE